MINDKQQLLKQQLETLRLAYAQELPIKIAALKADWQQFKSQPTEHTLLVLKHKSHGLSGSGATFGFAEVSKVARILEASLTTLSHSDFTKLTAFMPKIDSLLFEMESAINAESYTEPEFPRPLQKKNNSLSDGPRALLMSDNIAGNDALHSELQGYGIYSEILRSAQQLLMQVETIRPHAIVFEMIESADANTILDTISQVLRSLFQSPALIIISPHSDMLSRLKAVRAGAAAFLIKPINVAELVDFIRLQCRQLSEPAYRIVVIDDDAALAHKTALVLQRAGLETHIVTNPMTVLEEINNFQPELILLDLGCSACTSLELAAVIRQQCAFNGIGIVFFSIETAITRHIETIRTGGDEFFDKSMPPKELVAAVEAKAKRVRAIQGLMLRDGLTGLLNRASFDDYLQIEIAKSTLIPCVFSYVMLNLDHFKGINDRFGYLAGDKVIKALGQLLRQGLRAVDVAGRYGGEVMAILLPATSATQAEQVIGELLREFSAFTFNCSGREFSATFSAGIAEFPCFRHRASLMAAADQALYRAKVEGRNRIYVSRL